MTFWLEFQPFYLQAKGLWTDKKLAKKVEEVKQKTHWDFVLEEMAWLSDVRGFVGKLKGISGSLKGISGSLKGILGRLNGNLGKLKGIFGTLKGILGG